MLQIREDQMEAFRAASRGRFEAEMLPHLSTYAGRLHVVCGDEAFQALIHAGVDRAAHYRLTKRGPVQLFLELMCTFGWGFDTDPQFPWAQQHLTDTTADQMPRADALFRDAISHIDAVAGTNGEVALGAFYALRLQFPPRRYAEFGIDHYLASVSPAKFQVIGPHGLDGLRSAAREVCASHALDDRVATSDVVTLMFLCGHRVFDDPLYSWVKATLERPGSTEERIDKLERKTAHYLDATIAYWERVA